MSAHSLDTHRIVKRLQQAGFSDAQAETVTDVVREAREFDLSNLATKADIALLATKAEMAEMRADMGTLRAEMRADMGALRADMGALRADMGTLRADMTMGQAAIRSEIAEAKTDLLKWVIGLVLVQGGIVVTLIKLLPSVGH